jgi:hypothetical protein
MVNKENQEVTDNHRPEKLSVGSDGCRADVWNPMVKLMNEHPDADVRAKAKMLLGHYNTASGKRMKRELEMMLQEHGL